MAVFPQAPVLFNTDPNWTAAQARVEFERWLASTLQLPGAAEVEALTIANGQITPTRAAVIVDTEGGAPADDLSTIATANMHAGAVLMLCAANSWRTVKVKHGTGAGGIALLGGVDCALSTTHWLMLRRVGDAWAEMPPLRAATAQQAATAAACTGNAATATSATSAATAAACTGNAATASDMAAGHALAGATTIGEVRNRVIGSMTAYLRDMRAGDIVMRAHEPIRTLDDGLPEALELNGAVVSLATFPRLMRVWWGAVCNGWAPAFYRCNADGARNAEGMYMKLLDMRGYVPRGWDHWRGIDTERVLLTQQEDAIRNITGTLNPGQYHLRITPGQAGAFYSDGVNYGYTESSGSANGGQVFFDASRVVPTAAENRMRNVALMFIIYV